MKLKNNQANGKIFAAIIALMLLASGTIMIFVYSQDNPIGLRLPLPTVNAQDETWNPAWDVYVRNLIAENAVNGSQGIQGETGPQGPIGLTGATGAAANQPIGPYSFLISMYPNGTYYAQNGTDSSISWTSTNGGIINTVLNSATSGSKIVLTTSITIPSPITGNSKDNIELCGLGRSTIISVTVGTTAQAFNLTGVNGWYIHDLAVNCIGQVGTNQQGQDGIYISKCNNMVLERVYESNAGGVGINFYVGNSGFKAINCEAIDNYNDGIAAQYSTGGFFTNNIVRNVTLYTAYATVGCSNVTFSHNQAYNTGYGYAMEANDTQITVSENTFLNNRNGIVCEVLNGYPSIQPSIVTISGNVIGNDRYIDMANTYRGIQIINSNYTVTITGNTIYNFYSGLISQGTNCTIKDNTFLNCPTGNNIFGGYSNLIIGNNGLTADTLGYATWGTGTESGWTSSTIVGYKFQMNKVGFATYVSAAMWADSGVISCKAAIYSDNNGTIGTLIAVTNEVTGVGTSQQRQVMTFANDVILVPANYWVCVDGSASFTVRTSTGDANQCAYKTGNTYGTFPSTIATPSFEAVKATFFVGYMEY